MQDALEFAKQHVQVSDDDMNVIMHARKSLLFAQGQAWSKKDRGDMFDVTMGAYDGAEACEVVGAYILHKLAVHLDWTSVGLYRDDGLAVLKDASGPVADRVRKQIIEVFKSCGLKITIESNLRTVNYLDITMCLESGTYKPYRKPNDTPLYVSAKSNHPPQVLKSLPVGINKRLAMISSSKEVFEEAVPEYADALAASGHPRVLVYDDVNTQSSRKRKRGRDIIWFNPPYSANVRTNIGGQFLALVSKHFPKNAKLRKLFNRNTLKVGYSCMPNMETRIKGHNKKMMQPKHERVPCNCRVAASCPLKGECKSTNVVYEADVTSDSALKTYTGMSAPDFKSRYGNHMTSLRHERYEASTELAKYVWSLKRQNKAYEIGWSIKERARAYTNVTKRCNLCIAEKYHISISDRSTSLNKRTELVSKCRHSAKFLLGGYGVT